MKKYLVTGGAGFIGSTLVDRLVEEEDCEVTVWDNLSSGKKENLNSKAKFHLVDIHKIRPEKYKNQFDAIFHLAGTSRIQPSFDDPVGTHSSNVTGTIKILEIARLSNLPFAKIIYAGSSSFYYDTHANPYACTKWMGEEYCKLYSTNFRVPTAIARFFNVYGPRQIDKGAYATVIGIFEREKREGSSSLPIAGLGEHMGYQRRDFIHVDDIVSGLIAMKKEYWYGEIFDLGTGKNHAIMDIAKMFNPSSIRYVRQKPGEAKDTLADISYTKEKLDWEPTQHLEDYIKNFIANLP